MKAISIKQPWAWAILHAGKDIENRTWNTEHRDIVIIHAGQKYDHEGHKYLEEILGISVPSDLPCGGIVGIAEIIGCVTESASKWFTGPYGFELAYPEPLLFIRHKGQLGLFEVKLSELK